MKILLKLLILAACIFLTSCGSDSFADELAGTWNLESFTISGCEDASENETLAVDTDGCIVEAFTCNVSLSLTADGTGTATSEFFGELETESLTYTANDDTNSAMSCDDGDCVTMTIVDGKLIVATTPESDGCVTTTIYTK